MSERSADLFSRSAVLRPRGSSLIDNEKRRTNSNHFGQRRHLGGIFRCWQDAGATIDSLFFPDVTS